MSTPQTLPEGIYLTDKQRHLYEVTGHLGPWTTEELTAAGVWLITSVDPSPPPPPEVRKAEQGEDLARLAYDEAHARWGKALSAASAAREAASNARRHDKFLRPIEGSNLDALTAAAEAYHAADEAYEQRQTAAAALVKAKGVYRASLRNWHRSMTRAAARAAKNGKR